MMMTEKKFSETKNSVYSGREKDLINETKKKTTKTKK